MPFYVPRGRRKRARYYWDARFVHYLYDDPGERGTMWLRLTPTSLTVQDLSYSVVSS